MSILLECSVCTGILFSGGCLSTLLSCSCTHRHWLLLLCFPSRVKKLTCRKKNLKTLGFYSYRQYGCNCTWLAVMYQSKHCMILNNFQNVLLWDTQHSDAGETILISAFLPHRAWHNDFYLYICICRAIYLLICNFTAKELIAWTLWSPFSIIAEGVVRSNRHIASLVLKHFYLDKDFPINAFHYLPEMLIEDVFTSNTSILSEGGVWNRVPVQ